VLTWHVHGNYLYYLTQVPHTFYVLADETRSPGYAGAGGHFRWGANVIELPAAQARDTEFDCILFQSRSAWLEDQHRLLSSSQKRVPRIYLEHDPPQDHPSNTRHPVDDPHVLLVHCTPFNQLMWDSGRTPTCVIEHGVVVPEVAYDGSLERGIAVVNHLARRGRRLGADVFESVQRRVAVDLVGMESEKSGGIGEIPNPDLPAFLARYRFYFHPVRWTSLGLAAIEAMMVGLPVVGLATTELVTVIRNGDSGYVDTRVERLIEFMQHLLRDRAEAQRLGAVAKRDAGSRFGIERFVSDWMRVFREVTA
jgi:hypothetical protein